MLFKTHLLRQLKQLISAIPSCRFTGVNGLNKQLYSTQTDAKPFFYQDVLSTSFSEDTTNYRLITQDYVSRLHLNGRDFLSIDGAGLTMLCKEAMADMAHLLRSQHLKQLKNILDDPEATSNDKFVALTLLKNANIASAMVLPGCQDTGTAIIIGKRGHSVWTDGLDEEHLARGVYDTYTQRNLRYSQVAPLDMFTEVNTSTNLPAQMELYSTPGDEYKFLFIAKGGGSANKTYLYQQTKAVLNQTKLLEFINEKIKTLGK